MIDIPVELIKDSLAKAGFGCKVKRTRSTLTIKTIPQRNSKFSGLYRMLGYFDDDGRVSVSRSERKHILAKTDGKCFYCGIELVGEWHIDHFMPRSKGGVDHFSNYVPACPDCNLIKSARMPNEAERKRFSELRS